MSWCSAKWIKVRILMVSVGFVLFLTVLFFRTYQLQIAENDITRRVDENQYKATLPVKPKRGTITDRNGIVLAMDVEVASIGLHPKLIVSEKKEEVIKLLSKVLELPAKEITAKINSEKNFEWLARRIASEKGQEISNAKIKGISVMKEYRRFYPLKEVASNLLGAVGYDSEALGGIEMALDSWLKSKKTTLEVERDGRMRYYTPIEEPDVTHNVVLSIDVNIQYMAEKYLAEQMQQFKAESAFAIVMDPKTGEVLAMANAPTFNPNIYWEYPVKNWKNHAVIDSFEPGSTFKTILAASALKSGKVKPEDKFDCEMGKYKVGTKFIRDAHPHGVMTFNDIIKVSSNIGVTKIGQKIGKEIFYNTIKSFGFGEKTALKLPGEETGILSNYKRWSLMEHSNIAFGQGMTVTGMQMAQGYATIANKGVRMKPILVKKIETTEKSVIVENKPQVIEEVLAEKDAVALTKMLLSVVEGDGTGKLARLDNYTVAGKTGTAQKVNPKTKAYDPHNYVGSFIGFVPATNPEFVIFVVFDSPKAGSHMGGVVAAPVFQKIARDALAYRGMLGDKKPEVVAQKKEH